MTDLTSEKDQDRGKGAVEQDKPKQKGNTSMPGQLGHRDQDPLLKSSDSDFPEPGSSPEHSGEYRVWNRHSCPLPLILNYFCESSCGGSAARSVSTIKFKINFKSGGQECPPHTNSYSPFSLSL